MRINRGNSTLPTRLAPGHLPSRGGFERNPFVGCGLLDAPPKNDTFFGFYEGKYMNCLRQCDFALQNHWRVRDAAPYDFCRNMYDKPQFTLPVGLQNYPYRVYGILRTAIYTKTQGATRTLGFIVSVSEQFLRRSARRFPEIRPCGRAKAHRDCAPWWTGEYDRHRAYGNTR